MSFSRYNQPGKVSTMIEEKLGPLDPGPPQRWAHIVIGWDIGNRIALCGHDCTKLRHRPSNATSRICPDCERIERSLTS